MGCYDKNRHRCGGKQYGICVKSEITLPEFTTLETDCNSLDDIDSDLYILIGGIKEEIDLSEVISECQTLPTPVDVKTYIQFLIDRDCAQQAQIDALLIRIQLLEDRVTVLEETPCV